jgi:hypothetical protein
VVTRAASCFQNRREYIHVGSCKNIPVSERSENNFRRRSPGLWLQALTQGHGILR